MSKIHCVASCVGSLLVVLGSPLLMAFAQAPKPLTSLENPQVEFTDVGDFATLSRGDVTAIIGTNAAGGAQLPAHRAGYSGVVSLTHRKRPEDSLFVPAYAGLNFEHIHDGTTRDRDVLFEPRRAPMQLRRVNAHTVELYQAPTPTWALESCQRYELLEDGAIQLTFECIPRKKTFKNGYIGLFWASYIHQPESLDIHFRGRAKGAGEPNWIRGVTPSHGVKATHVAPGDKRPFAHDDDFPLSLVFNQSDYVYVEPWYFGVSHGLAFAQVFRAKDRPRLTQSPSGGGKGNPAWDFQYFIPEYQVDRRYQFVMRAVYVPFESPDQVRRAALPHLRALNPGLETRD